MPSIGPSLRLGRLGRNVLANVESISYDGDSLSMRGRTATVATAELPRLREQLLGLNQSLDTLVIPIRCDDDDSLDGYYTDVRCGVDYDGGNLDLGHLRWSISARRVPGRDAPGMEIIQLGGHRSNAVTWSAAASDPWHGLPSAVESYYNGEDSTFDATRVTASGASVGIGIYTTTGIARRVAHFTVAPANYYDGAARIEVGGDVVTGRQIHDTDGSSNGWLITNDLVEVSGTAAGLLKVRTWQLGLTWLEKTYRLATTAPADLDTWGAVTVIRNTPEVCVLRVAARAGASLARHTLDITIRRGSRLAEIMWRTDAAILGTVAITPTDAATSVTAGIRASSASPRWMILSPSAVDKDTTDGFVDLTTDANRFSFALGADTSDSLDAVGELSGQYFGALECWQQVVGR